MTSSESEVQGRPRKRSRASNSGEDGAAKEGKKARGRPRVDTQDATAADRRRTQIRLAQRAYRQRKETTIASLKQQGSQLHSIIDQMNKTFLRFNDAALKSGLLQLNAALTRELKHATETFTSLAKTASEIENGDDEQGEGAEQSVADHSSQRAQVSEPPGRDVLDIGWGYTAAPERSEKTTPIRHIQTQTQPENYFNEIHGSHFSNSLIPRRQFTVGELFDQSRNYSAQQQAAQITSSAEQQPLPFGLVDILSSQNAPYTHNPNIFSVNIPTPDVTPPMTRLPTPPLQSSSLSNKTLSPTFTYSHDEPTFARRLTRAALETGFHILSAANLRPAALNYVFKLSLPYFSLDQLRARFKLILSRSINEDLDFWETPFIHLGGAGTHYPRRDAKGNIMPMKNVWTIRQIGPFEKRMARLENVADGRWEDLPDFDLSEFQGEWFDAHDVQGYLEDRWSCTLDSKSSFASCMIEEEEFEQEDSSTRREVNEFDGPPGLTHSSTNSSASSAQSVTTTPNKDYGLSEAPFGLDMEFNAPAAFESNPHDFSKFQNVDLSFDQTLGLDLAPGFDYGFPLDAPLNNVDLRLDLMGVSEAEQLPVVKQKRKTMAYLEVGKLVDDLIKHGVCLGRAPGFRRKDVDMAVRKALVSTF